MAEPLPPHHPNCMGCGDENAAGVGMRMARDGDRVRGSVTLDRRHEGAPGYAHGGAVSTILDDALGMLLFVLRRPAVTARLEVDFRRPAYLGRAFEVEVHELFAEYIDDGYSGARLDRPGLDALRDSAERGLFEAVLCLTPDRLARSYPYQFLVLEELARHGVRVLFFDAPDLNNDPQVRLLTEMQGVIAEYERAKIAERNRRGRLFRARSGEVVHHKVPYGYRRVGRSRQSPAHLEVFEPEAVVVRRIFDDYVAGGHSMRQIAWRLYEAGICSPSGKPAWRYCSIAKILRNPAYVGTLYCNCVEVLAPQAGRKRRQRKRPQAEWIFCWFELSAQNGARGFSPHPSTCATTTPGSAHVAPNRVGGCSAAWCGAARAESSPSA